MRNGLFVLVLVVVLATAFGLYRRATEGRLREHRPSGAGRLTPSSAVPSSAVPSDAGPSVAEPGADGHPVPVADDAPEVGLDEPGAGEPGSADHLTPADLGAPLGERATLVHFSTAFCQPCRATRRTLDDVAGMVDGVAAVEIDAEANLDLVRRLDVRRTPTVLVLDASGAIVRRAVGAPRKPDVIAALGRLL